LWLELLLTALPKVLEKFPDTLVLFVGESYAAQATYLAELQEMIVLQLAFEADGVEVHVAHILQLRFLTFRR